jgi:LPXTG-motif cell wall-anchored protein
VGSGTSAETLANTGQNVAYIIIVAVSLVIAGLVLGIRNQRIADKIKDTRRGI